MTMRMTMVYWQCKWLVIMTDNSKRLPTYQPVSLYYHLIQIRITLATAMHALQNRWYWKKRNWNDLAGFSILNIGIKHFLNCPCQKCTRENSDQSNNLTASATLPHSAPFKRFPHVSEESQLYLRSARSVCVEGCKTAPDNFIRIPRDIHCRETPFAPPCPRNGNAKKVG